VEGVIKLNICWIIKEVSTYFKVQKTVVCSLDHKRIKLKLTEGKVQRKPVTSCNAERKKVLKKTTKAPAKGHSKGLQRTPLAKYGTIYTSKHI
jgi:hypothetical protein